MNNCAYSEDKKCRICGFADMKNVNIFTEGSKNLYEKIITVFPIVLYRNDPLPKNICKKCILNVTNMFNEIQRTMRIQNRWITNVRAIQPNHNYVQVLDMIEISNQVTKDSIKSSLGEDICSSNVHRLFNIISKDVTTTASVSTSHSSDRTAPARTQNTTTTSFSLEPEVIIKTEPKSPTREVIPIGANSNDVSVGNPSAPKSIKLASTVKSSVENSPLPAKPSTSKSHIEEIQSILESNGCTLLTVVANKAKQAVTATDCHSRCETSASSPPPPSPTTLSKNVIPQIKQEILDEIKQEEKCNTNECNNLPLCSTNNSDATKCNYCPLQFNSLETLSTHQLLHMRLCIPKIFQKKYLNKRARRGRLISVQERKCIRCLNCWRVFVDNKSILEHWSLCECDFYCHICGKEFPSSPKMLREHVPAAHGVSYRSSKFHRVRLSTKIMMSVADAPVADNLVDLKIFAAATEQEPLPFEGSGQKPEYTSSLLPTSIKIKKVPPKTTNTSPATAAPNEVACIICQKAFANIKARNSHMRAHKPSYAYGDFVLPPKAGMDLQHVNFDPYSNDDSSTMGVISELPGSSDVSMRNTSSRQSSTPSSDITTPIIRGVRKKFVEARPDSTLTNKKDLTATVSSSSTSNSAGSTAGGVIKVKSLVDLQQNSYSSSLWPKNQPNVATKTTTNNHWISPVAIKSEPVDVVYGNSETETPDILPASLSRDNMNYDIVFNCFPCGGKFPSKLELFRHKRKCQANNRFTCEFCPKSFVTCVDLQLHIMLIHKNPT